MRPCALLPLFLLASAASVACSHVGDDGAASTEANLNDDPTGGELAPDPGFATGGTLAIGGTSRAIAAGALSNNALAVVRNAETNVIVTSIPANGASAKDLVLPDVAALRWSRVLPQGDGGAVIVGGGTGPKGTGYYAARIDKDGAFDTTFRPDPLAIAPADAALDHDGRLLVAGALATGAPAVVRLNANGAIDPTFAAGGIWVPADAALGALSAVVAHDDGSSTFVAHGADATRLVHLDAKGALVASFGEGGAVKIGPAKPAHDALAAGAHGAVTYLGPKADAPGLFAFPVDAKGAIGAPADVSTAEGVAFVSASGNARIWTESTETTCTLTETRIGRSKTVTSTTKLSAGECAQGTPYVILPDGRRALVVTTPGAEPTSPTTVAIHVFAK